VSKYRPVEKPLAWFKANPENYRSHPQQQQAVLQESLRRFGVFRNVVARADGTILSGHGILAAAAAEGHTSFPCVIFDGSDEEARALMVADNEQQRLAEDDEGALNALLASIADSDVGLAVTGWSEDELEAVLSVADAEFTPQADSGTEQSLVGQWFVGVVIDDATHEMLKTVLDAAALPGESPAETMKREFPEMVRSRQNNP
jgi:hypothetical protein